MSQDHYQTLMYINRKSVLSSCQTEAKALRKQGRGLMRTHDKASQAGLGPMPKSRAVAWVGCGIRVNSISPGDSATPMQRMASVTEMWSGLRCFLPQIPLFIAPRSIL